MSRQLSIIFWIKNIFYTSNLLDGWPLIVDFFAFSAFESSNEVGFGEIWINLSWSYPLCIFNHICMFHFIFSIWWVAGWTTTASNANPSTTQAALWPWGYVSTITHTLHAICLLNSNRRYYWQAHLPQPDLIVSKFITNVLLIFVPGV